MPPSSSLCFIFFFNDTATTEIYTLSLHDALPIWGLGAHQPGGGLRRWRGDGVRAGQGDRKSTRLNSSHLVISYAVFCLKKKHNLPAYNASMTSALRLEPFTVRTLHFGEALTRIYL